MRTDPEESISLESIAEFQLAQADKLLNRISNFLDTPKGTLLRNYF